MSGGIRPILLAMSDDAFDAYAKRMVEQWSVPPKAIEVLEVLDVCAHDALTSDLVMMALDAEFAMAFAREGTTREAIVALASWRNEW